MCGRVWVDLPALIEVGIVAGYLEEDEQGEARPMMNSGMPLSPLRVD